MIDIHTHVLPGLDDGPRHMAETLAMLRVAVADGARAVIATPHYDGADPGLPCVAAATLREVQRQLTEHGLDIQIYGGFELALTPALLNTPHDLRALGLNGSRYVLVEAPVSYWSDYVEESLFHLQAAGLRPILAHAERYEAIIQDTAVAKRLAARDILLQVNADSVTGARGRQSTRTARQLLQLGLVTFLASDSHSPRSRAPRIRKATAAATRLIGPAAAEALVHANPQAVLRDSDLPAMPPLKRPNLISYLLPTRAPRPAPQPLTDLARPAVSTMKSPG